MVHVYAWDNRSQIRRHRHIHKLVPPIEIDVLPGQRRDPKEGRSRSARYDAEVEAILAMLWEAAGRICSKRLVPFLPQLVEAMEHHGHLCLSDETRARLLSISAATVDRILSRVRKAERARGLSTTRAGSLLKKHVPVRTFADWDERRPGFIEADLVAYCGTSTGGSYLHSLVMTDIATGWTECLALLYRDQDTVLRGLRVGRERIPFPLLGPLARTTAPSFSIICFSTTVSGRRSPSPVRGSTRRTTSATPGEKNGSVVRRFVGYDRFEGIAPCRVLAELYQTLRLYVNFFQPSMKLIAKDRQGSKVLKTCDTAQTPYQRVLASPEVSEKTKQALRRQFRGLDPVELLGKLKQLQDDLRQHAEVPACTLDESEQEPVEGAPSLRDIAVAAGRQVVVEGHSMAGGDGACRPVTVAVVSPGTGAARPPGVGSEVG